MKILLLTNNYYDVLCLFIYYEIHIMKKYRKKIITDT